MRKLLGLAATFSVLVLLSTNCGDKEDTTTTPADTGLSVSLVFDVGGEGDQSFNDSAARGIERAEAELGITYTKLTPNQDGSDRKDLIQLAATDSDLVIAVGYLFETAVADTANENPETLFGVVDTEMLDFESDPPQPYGDNVSGLVFTEHEGSFLVGAAAALKSRTGTIGFIGGVANIGGLIEKFQAGYEAGARAVNPDITILSKYISEAPDTTGWEAADRAQDIALSMYQEGADIIYHAAGGSGAGLFAAAKKHSDTTGSKVWGIGVDSDQYHTVSPEVKDYVLTSMLKRVDTAIFELIKSTIEDTYQAGAVTYDLSVGGVDYSTSGGFIDDIVEQLDDFKTRIIADEIDVPTVPETEN